MLALIQRTLILGVLLLAAAWLGWSQAHGISRAWQLLVLLSIALPHAPVLMLEFALLARFGRHAPAPRPTAAQLCGAWAGEVLWGLMTFGWRQPFRSNADPNHLPTDAGGRPGVLLVHGFVCNRGLWRPWMHRLRAQGVPFVAVNLEPVFGSIDDYVDTIEAAVARLEQATGRPPLIVAHSMGGLATRAWLRRPGADDRCAGVVTVATPHHGTWLARFALTPNGRQMRRHGAWLSALALAEPAARYARFTCFYGHCDNIVFPAGTAMLPGADNRHLPGIAHVHMVAHPQVFEEVNRRLATLRG